VKVWQHSTALALVTGSCRIHSSSLHLYLELLIVVFLEFRIQFANGYHYLNLNFAAERLNIFIWLNLQMIKVTIRYISTVYICMLSVFTSFVCPSLHMSYCCFRGKYVHTV